LAPRPRSRICAGGHWRKNPVTKVAVIRRIRVDDAEARLAALSAEGLVVSALRSGPMPQRSWKPEPISGKSIADTVQEDRDETA
jgi:hypothetical protein